MQLSEQSIKNLAPIVCGDCSYTPYLTGHNLVELFNRYSFSDVYEAGFPSRWRYTEDSIKKINNSPLLKQLIEEILDPRRFHSSKISIEEVIEKVNNFLKYDSYELRKTGHFYKVLDFNGTLVQPKTITHIGHEFVEEQIEKCQTKIFEGDYSGAITNARTLIEAILIEIIEKHEGKEIKNSGDVPNLYKQVKKILNLETNKSTIPDTIIQILSGLDSITSGLAGLSNSSADRHATKFKTAKHHAKLSVNCAMAFCDFLIECMEYQKEKNKNS